MQLADAFERIVGPGAPVEFRAYDGSRAGAPDADIRVEVRSPRAVSYLASAPGALGLARAYVLGDIEVDGDMYTALSRLAHVAVGQISWPDRLAMVRELAPQLKEAARSSGWMPPAPPPQEVRPRGRRHSKRRDSKVISHHYDVSNRFYEWVLGPSMTYTCACFPREDATLEEAQHEKHDLVARKLGLRAGMRMLDVGCGWGGMVIHAAKHYGVHALGATLSEQQAEWANKIIAEEGLGELAEVRHLDYRDVTETGFDVVASLGLTEHIGKAQQPSYFRFLYNKLRPGGRLLNHCITRPDNHGPTSRSSGFINRYVFPDGELVGVGHLVSVMHDLGFEVRHEENLREHYAKTLTGWCANLEEHWDEAVAEVGAPTARIWRLYMAGSRLGFEQNVVQLHQVLGVKLAGGDSRMPLRPDW